MDTPSTWIIAADVSSEGQFLIYLLWAAAGVLGGLITALEERWRKKRTGDGKQPIRLATVGLYGSAQIPVLIDILKTSKKSPERAAAARELRKFGPQAREAAPALAEAYLASKLSNDDDEFLTTLANMGAEARAAIPKLLEGYKKKTAFRHGRLTDCLMKIGSPVGSHLRQVSQTRRLRRPEKRLLRKIEKEHGAIPGSPGTPLGGGILSMILDKVIPPRLRGNSRPQPSRTIATKPVAKGATPPQTCEPRQAQNRKALDKLRVTCPDCQARFAVPAAAAGRRAKCAKCGHVFVLRRDPQIYKLASEEAGAA